MPSSEDRDRDDISRDPDWDHVHERVFPVFRHRFEEYREKYGVDEMRSDLDAFKSVYWHHVHMRPIIRRLEKELLGRPDA